MDALATAARQARQTGTGPSIEFADIRREGGDLVLDVRATAGPGDDTTLVNVVISWASGGTTDSVEDSFTTSTSQGQELTETFRFPLSDIGADEVQLSATINLLDGGKDNQSLTNFDLTKIGEGGGGGGLPVLPILITGGILITVYFLL